MTVHNAFTVDVEDYYQVSAFAKRIDRKSWSQYPERVVANTRSILELLQQADVKATFYVLGWVADRHPYLVREIAAAGHELGSHSYWHRLVYEMTPEEFRDDLRQSKQAIENAAGAPVTTYRAPSFSITQRSLWALDVLAEEGFRSDSSIFPVYHDRYGIPNAERRLHPLETASGAIWEFPPSVVRIAGMNLPVSGGGYFRLYPLRLSRRWLSHINRRDEPFVFYVHPWEIDPDQPRLGIGSRMTKFRHYVNLESTHVKLQRLVRSFRFCPLTEVIRRVTKQAEPICNV